MLAVPLNQLLTFYYEVYIDCVNFTWTYANRWMSSTSELTYNCSYIWRDDCIDIFHLEVSSPCLPPLLPVTYDTIIYHTAIYCYFTSLLLQPEVLCFIGLQAYVECHCVLQLKTNSLIFIPV